jgi:hypothetical protein
MYQFVKWAYGKELQTMYERINELVGEEGDATLYRNLAEFINVAKKVRNSGLVVSRTV